MRRPANTLLYTLLTAAIGTVLLSACTNDLKKIREISAKQVYSPADTTRGVNMIFSDSAKVKAQLLTPLMLEYQPGKEIKAAFRKMPNGIKVIFFDKDHKESGNIVADTGYYYETTKLVQLRKNVVITSAKGDTFRSEELNWDTNTHKINTNKPVDIRMADGSVSHASSMETNEAFQPYYFTNQTGFIYLDRNLGQ